MDCMAFMAGLPDGYFDLVIADPPYGIGFDGQKESKKNGVQIRKHHEFKKWDNSIPDQEFFKSLFRISKSQIIWGGNYFTKFLPPTKAWAIWYKGQMGLTMSDAEMAWTSLDVVTRMVDMHRTHLWQEGPIHPTQKPIALYKWVLTNYAKPGQKIFDPMMGSQSSRIAAHDMGFDYWGCELDADYFRDGEARFKAHIAKPALFAPEEMYSFKQTELF